MLHESDDFGQATKLADHYGYKWRGGDNHTDVYVHRDRHQLHISSDGWKHVNNSGEVTTGTKSGPLSQKLNKLHESVSADKLIELVLSGVPADLVEAVDSIPHAEAMLTRYHYELDPRQKAQKKNRFDKWYVHEDTGHSAFLYFDPSSGVTWNHWQAAGKNEAMTFYKGHGVKSLGFYLDTLHGRK